MNYKIEKFQTVNEAELKIVLKAFKEAESQFEPAFKTDLLAVDELYQAEMVGAGKNVYVVKYNGELIGFIAFAETTKNDLLIVENIPAVYIAGLFIDEKHRGQGLAQRLMKIAEDFAREKGIKYLKLLTFTNNQLARDFYTRSGFEDYESTMLKALT